MLLLFIFHSHLVSHLSRQMTDVIPRKMQCIYFQEKVNHWISHSQTSYLLSITLKNLKFLYHLIKIKQKVLFFSFFYAKIQSLIREFNVVT